MFSESQCYEQCVLGVQPKATCVDPGPTRVLGPRLLIGGFCLAAIVLETPGMRRIICVSPESTTYGLARRFGSAVSSARVNYGRRSAAVIVEEAPQGVGMVSGK